MSDQIAGASLLAMRSLAAQATDSAITTQVNMEALISNYAALQVENLKLREEIKAVKQDWCKGCKSEEIMKDLKRKYAALVRGDAPE